MKTEQTAGSSNPPQTHTTHADKKWHEILPSVSIHVNFGKPQRHSDLQFVLAVLDNMISAEEGEEDKLLYPDLQNVVEDLAGYIISTLLHIIEPLLPNVFVMTYRMGRLDRTEQT